MFEAYTHIFEVKHICLTQTYWAFWCSRVNTPSDTKSKFSCVRQSAVFKFALSIFYQYVLPASCNTPDDVKQADQCGNNVHVCVQEMHIIVPLLFCFCCIIVADIHLFAALVPTGVGIPFFCLMFGTII